MYFWKISCIISALLLLKAIQCISLATEVSHPIDTNHVIVIRDVTNSERSSNFGYSSILISSDSGNEAGWIFISAPTGNSSVYKGVYEPGVLWRCSLGKLTGENETCIVVPIDPVDSKIGKLLCSGKRCRNERRDESWFGMTLLGNSERIIICSPKWKRGFRNDNYKLNGLCYWLPTESLISEWFSTLVDDYDYTVQRLIPLVNQTLQVVERFPVWAWAQAGFSAHLTTENQLLLGAPGVNGWNGSVIRYQDNWTPETGTRERMNRKNDTEFSQYSVLQTDVPQLFYNLEYLGYAITQGNYFTLPDETDFSETMIAASSPRGSSLLGLVLIFEFPSNENDLWLPFHTVEGDQFGAYFGYVLLSDDLNGDGLDELLVGAPFRSAIQRKKFEENVGQNSDEPSGQNYRIGDEGCVFVYSSKEKFDQFSEPEIICGSNSFGARFGSVIASLGDINADGFNDIAIAAPFDNDSEGAVYIYHGKASFGINKGISVRPALKLTPSNLKLTLSGFGSSLFGGVDIDGSSTPDIVIGSHVSQTVVLLRSRPRIQFQNKIEAILNGNLLEKLKREITEFKIRSCTRISKAKQQFTSDKVFDVSIKLELDPKLGRLEVLHTISNGSERNYTYSNRTVQYKIQIGALDVACAEWNVRILEEIDWKSPDPTPLIILQETKYEEEVHKSHSFRKYDIVDGQKVKVHGAEFDAFCSNCPSRTVVTTEFDLPIALDNCDEDGDPICTPALRLNISLITSSSVQIEQYIIGSGVPLSLVLKLHNLETAETAYFPVFDLEWNNPALVPEDHPACEYLPEQRNDGKVSELQCRFGNVLQRNDSKILILLMKTTEVFAHRRISTLNFTATVFPGKDPLAAKPIQRHGISMKADVEGRLVGSDQNSTFSNEQYTKIVQTFKITLSGQSPIEKIRTTFWFPFKTLIGKTERQQVLFILQPQQTTCRVTSKNGKFSIADKLLLDGGNRNQRATTEHKSTDKRIEKPVSFSQIGTERRQIFQKHLVLELRCEDSQDTNCLRVECDSRKIPANSTIEIQFRIHVDNELIRQLMLKNDRPILHIQTVGSVRILEDEDGHIETGNAYLHDYSITAEEPIGIWVYIISGLLGVLLLALLIFILIRCGFFQRTLKEKWDALKLSKKGPVMEEPELWGRWQYSQVYRHPT